MTVQELLKSVDRDKFIKYYIDYCDYPRSTQKKKMIGDFYDQLITAEVTSDNSELVFAVADEPGSSLLDSFIVKREDLNKDEVETYAYEFSNPLEVLGYSISNACRHHIGYDIQYVAAIFYELSFFGYSLEIQEKEASSFMEDVKKSVEEVEAGVANFISSEEMFKRLDYKDTRSEAEKDFDLETARLQGEAAIALRKRLYKLELSY